MTERGDERPDPPESLEDTVDRLDEKAAKEHDSENRARETPKRGSPDEPPD